MEEEIPGVVAVGVLEVVVLEAVVVTDAAEGCPVALTVTDRANISRTDIVVTEEAVRVGETAAMVAAEAEKVGQEDGRIPAEAPEAAPVLRANNEIKRLLRHVFLSFDGESSLGNTGQYMSVF